MISGEFDILGLKKKQTITTRSPVESPEGCLLTGSGTGLFVSLTKVTVIDLLSEGEIDGLVSGEWQYDGTVGQTGYNQAWFRAYDFPSSANVRWLRSVYWNGVPVVNGDNEYNFQEVDTSFTPGKPNGATIGTTTELFDSNLTVTRAIGERLRGGATNAKVYRVFNKNTNAVRVNIKITQLAQTDVKTSDINKTTIVYNIYTKALFSSPGKTPSGYELSKREFITGKISYGYIRSSIISLNPNFYAEPDFLGWEIKIERETPESTTCFLRNITFVDSLTEIYTDVFTYPNSAIVASRFSAEYFSQVPERAYDTKGLKVLIPNNYNPVLRTYGEDRGGSAISGGDSTVDGTTQVWDGNFKTNKQWTDNPAWCFYDLLTNRRYGLGKYIDSDLVDKWTLYDIGKYCDKLVPDGFGGVEPYLTCNLYISSQAEAYKVVNDMASIFRGITYYAGGSIFTIQDAERPYDQFYLFTNANVENGDFIYSSSSRRVRHTTAIVRYNDKNNFYQPAVEYVEDFDGIRKYGIRELETTAFGTISRGQAIRWGKWALLTETLETESASFVAGMEGAYLRPGDVIKIFDENRKTNRYAGRISGLFADAGNTVITLDSQITGFVPTQNYQFSLLTPTYYYDITQTTLSDSNDTANIRRGQVQTRPFVGTDTDVVGGKTRITFTNAFDSGNFIVSGQLVYALQASGNLIDPTGIPSGQFDFYRVIRIEEKDRSKYAISAIQYAPGKYEAIETGLSFQTTTLERVPDGPSHMSLKWNPVSTDNVKIIDYSFGNNDFEGVQGFKVYTKTSAFIGSDVSGSKYLIATLPTDTMNGSYVPGSDGTYNFRAYSFNRNNVLSTNYASKSAIVAGINPLKDVMISSLQLDTGVMHDNLYGTTQTEEYATESPKFKWQVGYRQMVNIPSSLQYRISIREPSENNQPSKNIYFQESGYVPEFSELPSYTFDIDDNIASIDSLRKRSGPFRDFDVVVEAMDNHGNSSAGGRFGPFDDSMFSNPYGYDIVYATNPIMSGLELTTLGSSVVNGIITDQWITQDGDVKINIEAGNVEDDMAGGYVYTCDRPFVKSEAFGLVSTNKTIRRYEFRADTTQSSVTAAAKLSSSDFAYVGVSLFDTFDEAVLDAGNVIYDKQNLSNIVQIYKRGGVVKSLAFRAWAEVGNSVSSIVSYGFKNNTLLGTKTVFTLQSQGVVIYRFNLTFEAAFSNTNYTYFVYEQAQINSDHRRLYENSKDVLPNVIKSADSLIFEVPGDGKWFIGILG